MRRFLPVLILALVSMPARGGEVDSGGGVRGNGQVSVQDALGVPLAGTAGAGTVRAASGSQFGRAFPTPVMLVALEIGAVADGIAIAWEGSDDRGILRFQLERAEGGAGFADLGPAFDGPGPHQHLDREVAGGTVYRYRLRARLRTGQEELLGPWEVIAAGDARPVRTVVLPASPNPFRDAFSLSYVLREPAPVRWRLLDVRGALVDAGDLGPRAAGSHTAALRPAGAIPRGIYFLEVQAGPVREVQKVVKLP